jgi:uncharacterized protein (TIGR02145 family)
MSINNYHLRFIILCFIIFCIYPATVAQSVLEIEGKVKIDVLNVDAKVENVVIKSESGVLALMETSLPSLHQLPLASGFQEYGFGYQEASYYKSESRVYIDGLVKKQSGTIMQHDTIFTLPQEYRPRSRLVAHAKQDDKRVRLNIEPSGVAWVVDPPPYSLDWISLDNIDFYRHEIQNLSAIDASGNLYNTVKIGDQEWFVENLNTSRYNDGMEIPFVPEDSTWSNLTSGGWSWLFYNGSGEINDYKVYNAFAVATEKICPVGWRVPGVDDWLALSEYLGGANLAILQLKEYGHTSWHQSAINTRGFSAVNNPQRGTQGVFLISSAATWWTSTVATIDETYYFLLGASFVFLPEPGDNNRGLPVRCMRDINK